MSTLIVCGSGLPGWRHWVPVSDELFIQTILGECNGKYYNWPFIAKENPWTLPSYDSRQTTGTWNSLHTHQNLHVFIWNVEVKHISILNDSVLFGWLWNAYIATLQTPPNQQLCCRLLVPWKKGWIIAMSLSNFVVSTMRVVSCPDHFSERSLGTRLPWECLLFCHLY